MGNGVDLDKAFWLIGLLTGVDPQLLSSVCYVESHHKIDARVLQDGGSPSYGVCQVKLATARALGYVGRAEGLMEPSLNALYASRYLAQQRKRYGSWEKAISAYNAGHPIYGNRHYVGRVMQGWTAARNNGSEDALLAFIGRRGAAYQRAIAGVHGRGTCELSKR